MKKQVIALTLGLMSIGMFAQKSELKAVEKALKKKDFKTAQSLIKPLEVNESVVEAKYVSKYYFLKGQAYGKANIEKAAAAYRKVKEVEEAAKKSKYTKKANESLNALIKFVSDKAIKLYNDGKDYKNAAKNFYLTYKLSPTDTSFMFNAAISASLAKDYDNALKYYKELQAVGYNGVTTQYFATDKDGKEENLGTESNRDTMVKLGQYSKPRDETSGSKRAEIIKNIGYILSKQGKPEEAVLAIQEARKAFPKDLNLLLTEADLYIKLKKMDKFGELMEEAVKMDPNDPSLFFNLGVVNANQNNIEEAKKHYQKAIELKPDYGDAYMNLAVVILSGEKAIVEEMNESLSNYKKYDALEKKQRELYKEALPYLEKADELDRTYDTVRSLINIYDTLEMEDKADSLRPVFKELRNQQQKK